MSGMVLRKHQAEILELARDIVSQAPRALEDDGTPRRFFTAFVTPGGGKTLMARLFAHELIRAGLVERVIYITPNDNLRRQARRAFADTRWPHPIQLLTPSNRELRTLRGQGAIPSIERPRGVVGTYQQALAASGDAAPYAELASARATLVILDEFHHLSEAEHTSWREALEPVVAVATFVLAMTGTLHRTDEERIPWARVTDDGDYWPDVRYGKRDGLADGAILPVSFRMIDGNVVIPYRHSERVTLLSQAAAKEASRALLISLRDPEYAHAMAVNAAREFVHYKNTENPQAKALFICHDTDAAGAIGAVVARETGLTVLVAHNKIANAVDIIEDFSNGHGDALSSVAMTSEGFDCPALTHLVYLTNVIAPVSVAQAWGRPLRPNSVCVIPPEKQIAYIYTPMHPVLVKYVDNWMEEQIGFYTEHQKKAGKPRAHGRGAPLPPGSSEIGNEHMGDTLGRLLPSEEELVRIMCESNKSFRHWPPRDVLAMARTAVAAAQAIGL